MNEPFVSVIINKFYQMECSPSKKWPFFSLGEPIDGAIEAAQKQNYKNIEVIFADNDGGKGAGYMRNEALKRAKGEILYLADADTIFTSENEISNLVKVFQETNADAIVAGSIPKREGSSYFMYLLQLEYEIRENNMGEGEVDAGATTYMGIKRKVLEEIGGFPLGSTTIKTGNPYFDSGYLDWDLCGTLKEKGYKIWHTNKVKVYHILQTTTLHYFLKQAHQAWYRLAYLKRFKKIREGYTKTRMIMPLFFLASVPVWLSFGFVYSSRWFYLFILAILAIFFWPIDLVIRFYKKTKSFGVLLFFPIAFLRTLCWGIGAAKGFVDFYILRRYLP